MPIDQILEEVRKLNPEDKQVLFDTLAKDRPAKLTTEQQLAINEHVSKIVSTWANWIGIGSILALASSLAYIFFILPDKAISKAQDSIERRLAERTNTIEEKIAKILVDYGSETEN